MGVRRRAAVVVVVVLAAACGSGVGDGGAGPEVEVVERVGGASAEVVAVGDVLLAPPHSSEARDATLRRSEDGGRTWDRLRLPDAPPRGELSLYGATIQGDVVVLTGHGVVESDGMFVPAAYIWTSRDGRDWNASVLPERPSGFAQVRVLAAGDVLIAGIEVGGDGLERPSTYRMFRSDDDGASWAPADVAIDLAIEPGGWMELIDAWQLEDGRLMANLGGLGPLVAGPSEGAGGGPTTTGVGDGAGGPPSTVVVEPGGPPATATAPGGATAGGAPPEPTEAEAPTDRPEQPGQPDQSDESQGDPQVPAVLESDDGGATWRLAPCPPSAVYSPEVCRRPEAHGDLLVRLGVPDRQVSVDGGETWDEMQTDVEVSDGPYVDSVLQVRPGLWVATATSEATDTSRGFLLRSTDGIHWETVPPATLPTCGSSRPNTGFTPPVRFGGGWLVAYHCVDLNSPVRSMAYTMDDDGDITPIPGTRREGVAYRSAVAVEGPAVIDDRVVIGAERDLDPPDFVIVRP